MTLDEPTQVKNISKGCQIPYTVSTLVSFAFTILCIHYKCFSQAPTPNKMTLWCSNKSQDVGFGAVLFINRCVCLIYEWVPKRVSANSPRAPRVLVSLNKGPWERLSPLNGNLGVYLHAITFGNPELKYTSLFMLLQVYYTLKLESPSALANSFNWIVN